MKHTKKGNDRFNSESMQSSAYRITNEMNEKTTVEQMKTMITRNPKFELHHGGRCGWNIYGTAAMQCSIDVLKYLLDLEPTYVNLGNEFGWTPLFAVCHRSDEKEEVILEKVKLLIEYGADPSLGTTMSAGDSQCGDTDKGMTPLEAAEKRKLTKVVEFLKK